MTTQGTSDTLTLRRGLCRSALSGNTSRLFLQIWLYVPRYFYVYHAQRDCGITQSSTKMKNYLNNAIVAIFAACVSFSSCSKNSDATTPITSLQVTVTSSGGAPLSGANVKIFTTLSDYNNQINAAGTQVTNSLGVAVFDKGILPISYYVYADDGGCKANLYGLTQTGTLASSKTNLFSTSVDAIGKLTFTNNSIYPYKVYVNGSVAIASLQGLTSQTLYSLAGNYTIRVLQLSGYTTTPTDKTYTGTVTCGSELTTRFP